MIIGIHWNELQHEKRPKIIRELKGSGFIWGRDYDGDLSRPPSHEFNSIAIMKDMIIIDVERKIMWTGDWGSVTDMQVELNMAMIENLEFTNFG